MSDIYSEKEWQSISQTYHYEAISNEEKNKLIRDLIVATKNKNKEKILLLKNRISLSEIYNNETTPIFIAVEQNDFELVDFLIKEGANINIVINNNDALTIALLNDNIDMIKFLLQRGANPNFCYQPDLQTRLMFAVKNSNLELVKLLLIFGVDVDKKDNFERTALHYNFYKSPYTEVDRQIGYLLYSMGLDPKDLDINKIPAYGYLSESDLANIDSRINQSKWKKMPDYKTKRINQMRKAEKQALNKNFEFEELEVDKVRPFKSFKSYYIPKLGKTKLGKK